MEEMYVRGAERERAEAVYRKKFENIVRKLVKDLRDYEKNPQSHPLYPDEWDLFWTRRSEELESGKIWFILIKCLFIFILLFGTVVVVHVVCSS